MIGNQVTVYLTDPPLKISGVLRKQSVEGVWVYGGPQYDGAAVTFYPMRRVLEVKEAMGSA